MKTKVIILLILGLMNSLTVCSQEKTHEEVIDVQAQMLTLLGKEEEKVRSELHSHNPNLDFLKTIFLLSARYNHESLVNLCLQFPHHIDLEWTDDQGFSALMLACKHGNENMVEHLIQCGANIHARTATKAGLTVLNIACINGYTNIISLLLKKGANINQLNKFAMTVLAMVALEGDERIGIMEDLLQRGADINFPHSSTPLMVAVGAGQENLVNFLLKNNANIHATDAMGRSVLCCAVRGKQVKMVDLLIKLGAQINVPDNYGFTPLVHCVEVGDAETLTLLIKHGADINCRPKDMFKDFSALHIATGLSNSDIIEILLENGSHMLPSSDPDVSLFAIAIGNSVASKTVVKKIIKSLLAHASDDVLEEAKKIESKEIVLKNSSNIDVFNEVMRELGMSNNKTSENLVTTPMENLQTKQNKSISTLKHYAFAGCSLALGACLGIYIAKSKTKRMKLA